MYYSKYFKKILNEDIDSSVDPKTELDDVGIWNKQNTDITDNPELMKKYETEGIPPETAKKWIEAIQSWRNWIDGENGKTNGVNDKLQKIHDFASKYALDEAAQVIYKDIGKSIAKLMSSFGELSGSLRSLGNNIKVNKAISAKEANAATIKK